MDINNQLSSIVETLVEEIKKQLEVQAKDSITAYLDTALAEFDLDSKITKLANAQLFQKVNDYQFPVGEIRKQLDIVGAQAINELKESVQQKVIDDVHAEIAKIDFGKLVRDHISNTISDNFKNFTFPDKSINPSAIKLDQLLLSGDQINGGMIQNFSSVGIDDKATQCQVTILDTHVVVERPIITTGIDVKGDINVEGDLIVNGQIPVESNLFKSLIKDSVAAVTLSLNDDFFKKFSAIVYDEIKEKGLEASGINLNGRALVTESELGSSIIKSNLRRVGELTELQVRGETLLDNTLFVTGKRVGVNTLEPAGALAIWDEEVELVVRKKSHNVGYLGSTRDVAIVLGANNKENISLEPDGSVTINDLRLGALPLSTASNEPNWAGRAGEIVFNDSPAIGKPIGWVCLEGHRWAKFGTIQE